MSATSSEQGADTAIPAVTVVVVSYFSGDVLGECLESIVTQRGVSVEVIVVDNAAVERETEAEVRCREHGDVTYVKNEHNVGFGAGVNEGFETAETEFLCTVNPDATLEEGCLRTLLEPLRADRASITVPKVLHKNDPETISTCGLWNHFTGISGNRGDELPADHPAWASERVVNGLSGCVFATTADRWERIGGFDEEMFLYKDDVSVSWACQAQGHVVRFMPDARVRHGYERGLDGEKLHQIERGRMLLLAKYLPASAVLLLPSLLLAELLTWAKALSVGGDGVRGKLRAYLVLATADRRTIRERGAPFRRNFGDCVRGLNADIPWRELSRTGHVPDSTLLHAVGAVMNYWFRLNLWLYLAVRGSDRR